MHRIRGLEAHSSNEAFLEEAKHLLIHPETRGLRDRLWRQLLESVSFRVVLMESVRYIEAGMFVFCDAGGEDLVVLRSLARVPLEVL